MSIVNSLEAIGEKKQYSITDLVERDGLYHSFDHHGRFSDTNADRCIKNINAEINCASQSLTDMNYLIITWGTAYVYTLKSNGEVVANCHKFPDSDFARELLSTESIVEAYSTYFQKLLSSHSQLKIILTVSPVRHWKDGAVQNQRSKSRLLLASEKLENQFAQVHYFPSYEMMMDDLRDYRFYNSDMLHPSDEAIDYIWKAFEAYALEKSDSETRKEVLKIQSGLNHRPLYDRRPEHKVFLEKLLTKMNNLASKNEAIDFSKEIQKVNQRLDHF